MAIVERFKQESMYGLSTIKSGHCREAAGVERWLLWGGGPGDSNVHVFLQQNLFTTRLHEMTAAQVVELSVTVNNSPFQDYTGPEIKLIF